MNASRWKLYARWGAGGSCESIVDTDAERLARLADFAAIPALMELHCERYHGTRRSGTWVDLPLGAG